MKKFFFIYFILINFFIFSQENLPVKTGINGENFTEVTQITGKWQNYSRIIDFSTGYSWLKTFYNLWKEQPEELFQKENVKLLQIDNKLYTNFYKKNYDVYTCVNNIFDYALCQLNIQENIYSYAFIIDNDIEKVYKIRYWLCNVDYADTIIEYEKLKIPKYIKINENVYTCVTGRGTKLRNVKLQTMAEVFNNENIIKNEEFLVIGDELLKKIEE